MSEIYGAPQTICGNELVSILQVQSGNLAKCSATVTQLVSGALPSALANALNVWAQTLPTTKPTQVGVLWNNGGILSVS